MISNGFYRAFEDRFRGSRETILQRLSAYDAFVLPYVKQDAYVPQAVDIGCGRGEWLQYLTQAGFQARGVDTDAGMLEACYALELAAQQADGVTYLSEQPEQSLDVVSAFHVVEHMPFDTVADLAGHALRALKPGGILIFETPNPDNVMVAGRDFFLDPTHVRPLPAPLLAFLLEYKGFARVKIVPLNETASFKEAEAELSLWDVLSGASPDYAVIAQKAGDVSVFDSLSPAFMMSFGLTTNQLAQRFQLNLDERLRIAAQNTEFEQLRLELNQYKEDVEQRFERIFTSPSWRLTAPLRLLQNLWQAWRSDGVQGVKQVLANKGRQQDS